MLSARRCQEATQQVAYAFERLAGAYSPSTLRTYRSDIAAYVHWCSTKGIDPFPSTGLILSKFLDAQIRSVRPATLCHRRCAVKLINEVLGYPDPGLHIDVKLTIRRAFRASSRPIAQAKGLTKELRNTLLSTCGDTLIDKRDAALILLGFECLCRRSELVSIELEDLEQSFSGRMNVTVFTPKTDLSGYRRTVHLSARTSARIRAWIEAAGIEYGPLFRPVYRNKTLAHPLCPFTVTRILKKRATLAGMTRPEVENISSHSLRVGAAQQLTTDGTGLLQIMNAGGWRCIKTVARYVEKAEVCLWDDD